MRLTTRSIRSAGLVGRRAPGTGLLRPSLARAGVAAGPYDRRGYKEAMTGQLRHGIAGYSAIPHSSLEFLYGTETSDPTAHEELAAQAYKLGADLAQRAQAAFDRD